MHEVAIACASEVIARHQRSYERETVVFDPLHYLALLERKTRALDQAAPLAGWQLPECFRQLRRLLEARLNKHGSREYVQVLRPMETFALAEATHATGNGLHLTQIPRQSLTRQETFRFVKRSYNLEDIRVMKYQRLKNLVVPVTAAAYFAATFLGQKMKLRILCEKLLIISQRFFGIPPFRFYALADGIRRLLSGSAFRPPQDSPPDAQLELALIWSA